MFSKTETILILTFVVGFLLAICYGFKLEYDYKMKKLDVYHKHCKCVEVSDE